MATLTKQALSRAGLNPTLSTLGTSNDFANNGKIFLYIKNASGGARTVTLDIQQTVDSQAVTDRTVAIPDGEFRLIGPFPIAAYNDGSGNCNFSLDSATSVTGGAIEMTANT